MSELEFQAALVLAKVYCVMVIEAGEESATAAGLHLNRPTYKQLMDEIYAASDLKIEKIYVWNCDHRKSS